MLGTFRYYLSMFHLRKELMLHWLTEQLQSESNSRIPLLRYYSSKIEMMWRRDRLDIWSFYLQDIDLLDIEGKHIRHYCICILQCIHLQWGMFI